MPLQFPSNQINNNNNNEQNNVKWSDYASEFPTLAAFTTKSEIDDEDWEILMTPPLTGHNYQTNKKQTEKTFAQIVEEADKLSPYQSEMKPVPRKVAKFKHLQVNMTKISQKQQEQPSVSAVDEGNDCNSLYREYNSKGQRRNRKQLEKVQPTHDRYGNLLIFSR